MRVKLQKWVLERLAVWPPKLHEAKARWHIAQAVIKDINKPNYPSEQVIQKTGYSIQRLIELGINTETPLIIENADSLHPEEEFKTQFRRDEENKMWIAEEIGPDDMVISRAGIGDMGDTLLTISPHGDRFANANPNIIDRQDLPRATVTTFNLLVGTIGKKN